jgi:hypothetical protein
MQSLIDAFEQMRNRGLVAECECYCQHCGEEVMEEAAMRVQEEWGQVRGFVHLGESDSPTAQGELRIPLVFGSVNDGMFAYGDPGCLPVGEVVAECLKEQGIRYEWDRKPGSPILVQADASLSGVPEKSLHAIAVDEDHMTFRSPQYPDSCFDKVNGNPVRLVNLARLSRLKIDAPHLRGKVQLPHIGDHVKLGFLVWDAVAPEARKECGDIVDRMQIEVMWVEVTSVLRKHPLRVYRGELLNVPVFLDPAIVRIGSPVKFKPDHIYPVEVGSAIRSRG